eukprot:TRINITY_DN46725_c0_g1_i1.p1 TRINITY_DN46725_c0_g1~~TRINITY_DN46725_c0_g1_i1.p1  ORF type:complete len:383 (+),score=81.10 TRINITY_DN46725_c0_g1_i1:58-1206(+)
MCSSRYASGCAWAGFISAFLCAALAGAQPVRHAALDDIRKPKLSAAAPVEVALVQRNAERIGGEEKPEHPPVPHQSRASPFSSLNAMVSKAKHAPRTAAAMAERRARSLRVLAYGFVEGVHRRGGGAGSAFAQEDETAGECHILSDSFDFAMQALLFFLCLSTVLLKWYLEQPRRQFWVFSLDMSKQVVAALWYHFLNMTFAMWIQASRPRLEADECAWYFVNFMIDTTLGLVLNYVFLKYTEKMLGYNSGFYWKVSDDTQEQSVFDTSAFLLQLSLFVLIVTLSKLVVVATMFLSPPLWSFVGVMGTTWIKNTDGRLFFVMVLTPMVMDTIFFCATDEFIKYENDSTDDYNYIVDEKIGPSERMLASIGWQCADFKSGIAH